MLESLLIDPAGLTTVADGTRVFPLRGSPLEVLSLRHILYPQAPAAVSLWGVVTQTNTGERQILLVDQVEAKREVVIRSLGPLFQNLPGVSATAVLAGGLPALVLDVDQLIQLAKEGE